MAVSYKKGFVESIPGTGKMATLYVIGPLGYLVAIGVSFWNIYAGIALYLAIVLLYIPPQRLPESRSD